jgi:hypothetical protein
VVAEGGLRAGGPSAGSACFAASSAAALVQVQPLVA